MQNTPEKPCVRSPRSTRRSESWKGLRGLLGEGRLRKDKMCLHTGDTVLGTSVLEGRTESLCRLAMRGTHTG